MLVLNYMQRNYHKILHSSYKRIASDSDLDEAFKSMHQSILTKIKNFGNEDCVVETILRHSIRIFEY